MMKMDNHTNLIIIKAQSLMPFNVLNEYRELFMRQKEEGLVLLPANFDVLVVRKDNDVKIINMEDDQNG